MDLEHKSDPDYMKACGIDMHSLLISQPLDGGSVFDIIKAAVGLVDLIVVDSVAALASAAELDADSADQFVGVQARMMSQNLKVLPGKLGLSNTALVFTNQIRQKIGVMYGNPETTPGGMALKFYACVRMRVSQAGQLGPKGKEYGITSRVKVVKNCCAAPWKTAEIDIKWGEGIDEIADVLDAAVGAGVVDASAGYYKMDGELIAHGREAAKNVLRVQPEMVAAIRERVYTGRNNGDRSETNND